MGFSKIVNILKNNDIGILTNALSGAGGGLAAGLSIFFDAEYISSFENIKANKKLFKMMEQVDYVITGEGIFDETSLLGKGASAIIKLATELNKKVFLNKFSGNTILSDKAVKSIVADPDMEEIALQSAVRYAQEIPNTTDLSKNLFSSLKKSIARDDFDQLTRELLGIEFNKKVN